jgi:hypothetical protein
MSNYEERVRRALADKPYDGGRDLREVVADMKNDLVADSITKSKTLEVLLLLTSGEFPL